MHTGEFDAQSIGNDIMMEFRCSAWGSVTTFAGLTRAIGFNFVSPMGVRKEAMRRWNDGRTKHILRVVCVKSLMFSKAPLWPCGELKQLMTG